MRYFAQNNVSHFIVTDDIMHHLFALHLLFTHATNQLILYHAGDTELTEIPLLMYMSSYYKTLQWYALSELCKTVMCQCFYSSSKV